MYYLKILFIFLLKKIGLYKKVRRYYYHQLIGLTPLTVVNQVFWRSRSSDIVFGKNFERMGSEAVKSFLNSDVFSLSLCKENNLIEIIRLIDILIKYEDIELLLTLCEKLYNKRANNKKFLGIACKLSKRSYDVLRNKPVLVIDQLKRTRFYGLNRQAKRFVISFMVKNASLSDGVEVAEYLSSEALKVGLVSGAIAKMKIMSVINSTVEFDYSRDLLTDPFSVLKFEDKIDVVGQAVRVRSSELGSYLAKVDINESEPVLGWICFIHQLSNESWMGGKYNYSLNNKIFMASLFEAYFLLACFESNLALRNTVFSFVKKQYFGEIKDIYPFQLMEGGSIYGCLNWYSTVNQLTGALSSTSYFQFMSDKFIACLGGACKNLSVSVSNSVDSCSKLTAVVAFTSKVSPDGCVGHSESANFIEDVVTNALGTMVEFGSEVNTKIVDDAMPSPGLGADGVAYKIVNDFSRKLCVELKESYELADGCNDFILEFCALTVEDTLFAFIRKTIVLIDVLRKCDEDIIVLPYNFHEFEYVKALASAIEEECQKSCLLIRVYTNRDRYSYSFGYKKINHKGIVNVLKRFSTYRLDKSNQNDSMLLISSLGDGPYYKSAVEVLSASNYDKNYVFNLNGEKFLNYNCIKSLSEIIQNEALSDKKHRDARYVEFERLIETLSLDSFIDPIFYPYKNILHYALRNFGYKRLSSFVDQVELIYDTSKLVGFQSIITLPGRSPVSRALTIIANRSGINTTDVQAFYISKLPRYKGSLGKNYCGITEDQLSIYVKNHQKRVDQKINRIGSLMIDNQLSGIRGCSKEETRASFLIRRDKFVIFFVEQHGDGGISLQILRWLINMLHEDIYLIVKLHPRGPVSTIHSIEALARESLFKDTIYITKDDDLYRLILASDLVVTQFSNVGLESAVLGKPVLSVSITKEPPIIDFGALGISDVVRTCEDMVRYIEEYRLGVIKGVSRDYFTINPELGDGMSGDRVISISRQ